MAHEPLPTETLHETTFLRLRRRGGWDYVQRTGRSVAVALIATTDDDRIVLVEQYRVPVDQQVIELPAANFFENLLVLEFYDVSNFSSEVMNAQECGIECLPGDEDFS